MATAPAPSPSTSSAPSAAAPASQPAKPQLQSYTAYEKNGLKITLTPKVNPAQQGMVQILARFTATGDGVRNVNFQAAVPKVSPPKPQYPSLVT
jgi:AP-1 complex subunit gamma-1